MRTPDEFRARLAEITLEVERLAAIDEPTPEDMDALEAHVAEGAEVRSKLEQAEARAKEIDAIRAAAQNPANRESGFGGGSPTAIVRDDKNIYDLTAVRSRGAERGSELRDRAMRALEDDNRVSELSDEQRSGVERLIRNAGRLPTGGHDMAADIAEHILVTGSPEYERAFFKVLSNPTVGPSLLDRDEAVAMRAAMSLTDANGGYLVPFTLDPTIVLTNNGATNPFREIATIKQTTTDTWSGVTSAGVSFEWLAEASEAADGSPTFGQVTITPQKAAIWVQATFEVIQDSNIANDLGELIADAKSRNEATAFATGSGSGQPKGVITAVSAVTASRVAGSSGAAGAADFVVGDIYALSNALPARHRPGSAWVAEHSTLNKIRQFATGSGPQHGFWADLGMNTPSTLLGRPVYESSAMDSTIVSGSNDDILLLGDFRKYYIVDRIGMSLAYEPLVKGSNRRPTGEVGWFAHYRVGADCIDPGAFRLLRV